jgi:hypothetical protein
MKTARWLPAAWLVIIAACSNGPAGVPSTDPAGSLGIRPAVDSASVGLTVRFATAWDSGSVIVGDTAPVSWSLSDSRVAAIEQQGGWWALVRALHQGTTTVTATDSRGTASAVLVVAGTGLVFTAQPTNVNAGAPFTPTLVVTMEDASGQPLTNATAAVTVALDSTSAGATLLGTTTVTPVNGVATFPSLSIQKAGSGYTLRASATGFPVAKSAPFAVAPAAAAQLVFSVQPSKTWETQTIHPAVQVAIQDAFANAVVSGANPVTLAIGTNPSAGMLAGTTTVSAVSGIASFADLAIDNAGQGYTLVATAPGLTRGTSATFDITGVPASISIVSGNLQTGITRCTAPAPLVVRVKDRNGRSVGGATVQFGGPGTGGRTVTTAPDGVAWTYVMITIVGTNTVTASVGNVGQVTFTLFGRPNYFGKCLPGVVPPPVDSVIVTPSPGTVDVGDTASFTAALRDPYGNPLTGWAVTWSVTDSSVVQILSTSRQTVLVWTLQAGSAALTATSDGKSTVTQLVVLPPSTAPVASVTLWPATDSLLPGDSVAIRAILRDAQGRVVSAAITWTVSDPSMARILSTTGPVAWVQVLRGGSVVLSGSCEGKSGTAQLNVTPTVASVAVTPASDTMLVGDEVGFKAILQDDRGNLLSGRDVTWTVNDTSVAYIAASEPGLQTVFVRGMKAGSALLTATSEGKSASASIVVR